MTETATCTAHSASTSRVSPTHYFWSGWHSLKPQCLRQRGNRMLLISRAAMSASNLLNSKRSGVFCERGRGG